MPYGYSVGLCDAGDKIYVAGGKSLYSYDKASGLIELFDKSNVLSDIDIKAINYDMATKCLVVAYNNANIDLIFNTTEVYNLRDILNENTSTSISINDLYFSNGNCYVSTDLGISVINLDRKEISNTYIIGATGGAVRVYSTAVGGNTIYAATQEGIKYAPVNSTNLQDFNAWTLFEYSTGIPAKKAKFVEGVGTKVYAVIEGGPTDTLYEYDGVNWIQKYSSEREVFSSLRTISGTLYYSIYNNNNTTAGKQGTINAMGNFTIQNTVGHARPLNWFYENGISWEADNWNGFFKNVNGNVERLNPDGPYTASVYDLEVNNGILYVAPGGVDDSWGSTYNQGGFFIMQGMTWQNRNVYTDQILNEMFDFVTVAVNPTKGKTYFGSFFMGVAEYDHTTKNIQVYNKDNADFLEPTQGDLARTRISSMKVDNTSNLWIFNGGGLRPLKVVKNDGSWKDYTVPTSMLMKKMVFDRNGKLWAPIRTSTQGLYVWDNKGTIDDETDDEKRILGTGAGNGALPDAFVHCVAEDKDGNMWVGTNQGIAIFYCAGSAATANGCDADLITVERDGYLGYLFASESVRSITVDAANRKWVGTTNGLWLISADGKTEILKFNKDNSPLPANQITDIAIDDISGEVFIGTTAGLVSYQGDAIGSCADCDEAIAYPNPVKPDYAGPIAIKGLVEDAYVKITDASGTLVFQGKANGSQMVWDGKGYNGVKAKSGVYLVFSSTELGKEKQVGKILFIN